MTVPDSYIIFELAGSSYGIRSDNVQHVDMLEHVTAVPNTAPAVDGVVFSRGDVVPALNLRVRFGLPRAERTPSSRLVFLKVHERVVALIVDSAREFRRISSESVRPIEETLTGISGNYLLGVATVNQRLVLIVDIAAVLRLEETRVPDSPHIALNSAS